MRRGHPSWDLLGRTLLFQFGFFLGVSGGFDLRVALSAFLPSFL